MSHEDQTKALERAAAPALAAIAEDAGRAPRRLRPLFAAIGDLLFDLDLDLDRIRETAGLAGPDGHDNLMADFAKAVEQPAWSYLRDARLETAAHLLLETEISISEIGLLVGYGSPSAFRRALRGFLEMPPAEYRRKARQRLERAGPAPPGSETGEYWRRMSAGELSLEEARDLDDYLGRLAPGSASAASEEDERWAWLRRTLAEGLADSFHALPFPEQRRLVRHAVWFPDVSFFDLLSERGRESDPERGVEWALLAIDSLAANGMLETHPWVAAVAWARMARARWRADDLAGAQRDLEQTARDAEKAASGFRDRWQAESCRVAAACHWLHGRRRQALEMAGGAVAGERAAESGSEALARALVLRAEVRAANADLDSASAGARVDELRGALADLEEARDLGADGDQACPNNLRDNLHLWIRLLAALAVPTEIAGALPRIRQAASDDDEGTTARLLWLEAKASPTAEPLLRDARECFAATGDELWVARATLDLARLCLASGRVAEAETLATRLAASLGARAASPEDLAALEVLGRAAAPTASVASDDLGRAEAVLKRLEWQRRARRALDLA